MEQKAWLPMRRRRALYLQSGNPLEEPDFNMFIRDADLKKRGH
jgi:hypothetical protein